MELNEEQVRERLITEFGYPPEQAGITAEKLLHLESGLQTDFEEWWETGRLPETEVEGFTVKRLMEQRELNPVAAFLSLDWLLREPKIAKETLSRQWR